MSWNGRPYHPSANLVDPSGNDGALLLVDLPRGALLSTHGPLAACTPERQLLYGLEALQAHHWARHLGPVGHRAVIENELCRIDDRERARITGLTKLSTFIS